MLLDFVDKGDALWLNDLIGSEQTIAQYTNREVGLILEDDFEDVRAEFAAAVPPQHLEFFRQMPFYYEDDYAFTSTRMEYETHRATPTRNPAMDARPDLVASSTAALRFGTPDAVRPRMGRSGVTVSNRPQRHRH